MESIIKRYKETRRSHPLSGSARSLDEAVRTERTMLEPGAPPGQVHRGHHRPLHRPAAGELLRIFGRGG